MTDYSASEIARKVHITNNQCVKIISKLSIPYTGLARPHGKGSRYVYQYDQSAIGEIRAFVKHIKGLLSNIPEGK